MGLPVLSLVAGLGIGGLAVALAIRPTLENLIGGFILFLDKPIRVGDFCTFGSQSGTVESIGVRSTQIRALDRTTISIPNAQFADMQIVNWARCDEMLINETVGLRYETSTDQLRFVLVRIREMFLGHPRIDSDSARVRLAGYGASSIDVSVRVYARTREWNDFFAIKEDVMFRIKDIVEQSGTGFAFPSQTLYLGRDQGVNVELGEKAKQKVAELRRAGQLPFPRFAAARLERLEGRLSYPPRGSPDFNASEEELSEAGDERLSADPQQDESEVLPANTKGSNGPERK
jgi:MscS family membrane protein